MGCLSEDKYDTYAIAGDKEFAIRKLKNNRVVKEVSFSIDSQCVIRFRMDVSIFSQLKDRIDTIFPKESSSSKGLNKWNEQIDQIIRDYEIEFGKGMKSFSNQDKEAITRIVNKERLLDFKEATVYLARCLGVSRATIYNYLNWQKAITKVKVNKVNAFSVDGGKGNLAGVVQEASNLTTNNMKKIAKELDF